MVEGTIQAGNSPTPQTTLVILLGASEFPNSDYKSFREFSASARAIEDYFLRVFALPRDNWFSCFDSADKPDTILGDISDFLRVRVRQGARDVLVYYVGHGDGAQDDNNFYLTIKNTHAGMLRSSSICVSELATAIKNHARFLRRIYIFDCCFAGKATTPLTSAQGGNELLRNDENSTPASDDHDNLQRLPTYSSVILSIQETPQNELLSIQGRLQAAEQSQDQDQDQNERQQAGGVLLFCSSGRRWQSYVGEEYTRFTEAMLHVLRTGYQHTSHRFTFHDVRRYVIDYLNRNYSGTPIPEIHDVVQTEELISNIPFFRNPGFIAQQPLLNNGQRGLLESGISVPLPPATTISPRQPPRVMGGQPPTRDLTSRTHISLDTGIMIAFVVVIVILLLLGAVWISFNEYFRLIFVLFAGIGIAAIIFLIPWNRRDENEERWDTPIKVVALGFDNAGKTVFHTIMFNQLMTPGTAGFWLDTEPEKRREIIATYDQIARTGVLSPTTPLELTEELIFDGLSGSSEGQLTLFRCTFAEYSGEKLKDLFSQRDIGFNAEFERMVEDANIVWGILDGQKVLKFMLKEETDNNFNDYLRNLFFYMQKKGKTVHFLLTKWDLFEKKGYRLTQVIERLVEQERFARFLKSRTQFRELRFIPVSAFGTMFVGEDNKKLDKGVLDPLFVEIPLAYSILDFFKHKRSMRYFYKDCKKRGAQKDMYRKLLCLVREFEKTHRESNLAHWVRTKRRGPH